MHVVETLLITSIISKFIYMDQKGNVILAHFLQMPSGLCKEATALEINTKTISKDPSNLLSEIKNISNWRKDLKQKFKSRI